MSSVDTVFFGDFPYYSNLDESRLSVENTTNQFSFSEEYHEERNITKQTSSEKKDESSELSHLKTPEEEKLKTTPRKINAVSLLPDYLAKKIQSRKEEITIYFFNSEKRICFQKEELNKVFEHRKDVTLKELIIYVVQSYCRLFLNFEPIEIAPESFELKLASLEYHNDPNIDPFSQDLPFEFLYEADNLVLVRKERPIDKINDWEKLLHDKTECEIIEVLMPEKKESTIQFEKTKTISALKEKIATFSNQMGKIVLVTYYNFKPCENKSKIGDLSEKILEVYRERVQDYIDRPTVKNAASSFTNVNFYEELWKNPTKNEDEYSTPLEFFVNETAMFGKLTLSLMNSEIQEKYSGGMICSFPFSYIASIFSKSYEERRRTLSIHALVGIRNTLSEELILKFMYKNRVEIITYKFEYLEKKESFLKSLLKLGRIHNKKWDRIKE